MEDCNQKLAYTKRIYGFYCPLACIIDSKDFNHEKKPTTCNPQTDSDNKPDQQEIGDLCVGINCEYVSPEELKKKFEKFITWILGLNFFRLLSNVLVGKIGGEDEISSLLQAQLESLLTAAINRYFYDEKTQQVLIEKLKKVTSDLNEMKDLTNNQTLTLSIYKLKQSIKLLELVQKSLILQDRIDFIYQGIVSIISELIVAMPIALFFNMPTGVSFVGFKTLNGLLEYILEISLKKGVKKTLQKLETKLSDTSKNFLVYNFERMKETYNDIYHILIRIGLNFYLSAHISLSNLEQSAVQAQTSNLCNFRNK